MQKTDPRSRAVDSSGGPHPPVRFLLACDIRLLLDCLRRTLAEVSGFEVLGEATHRAEVLEKARMLAPDVVLLDMTMSEAEDLACDLAAACASTKVVALKVEDTPTVIISCAESGIAAYVFRDGTIEDLLGAVHDAMTGELSLTPRQTADLQHYVSHLALEARDSSASSRLTLRELEIAELIDDGLSNKEIAKRLNVQVSTVKNHVHNILQKLNLHRRAQVAALLRRETGRHWAGAGLVGERD